MTNQLRSIIYFASVLVLLFVLLAWLLPSASTLAFGVFGTMGIVLLVSFYILKDK